MDWILDRLLPDPDFRTCHTRAVDAPPEAVWRALLSIGVDDLPVTRVLMRIRGGGRRPDPGAFVANGLIPELGREDGREVVIGRVGQFWKPRPALGPAEATGAEGFAAFSEPGWAKAAMGLQITPLDGRTLLAADTRVTATDRRSRRAFRPYWSFIRLGGAGMIRIELLTAVARLAERA
ncbi:hypothetical protein [Actinomadura harenae]|uniref:DUF2867 domain-containing protein n=1 Tax=Actinomadura harenae TaxID=2483351 RepID=A0A3M2MBW8_9ACTN|nr:hypothetical protein [Actinomadura harenae]RMI44688.1 hypothetical protein EBO15_12090 [Actinomadura harenae]